MSAQRDDEVKGSPMSLNDRGGWTTLMLAGTLATVVALQPKNSSSNEQTGAEKQPKPKPAAVNGSSERPDENEGPLRPLRDYFNMAGKEAKTGENAWRTEAKQTFDLKSLSVVNAKLKRDAESHYYTWPCLPCNTIIRFLIATVPDPADSGFGANFDQAVEAIQRALETQLYVIDRHWLPWKPSEEPGHPAPEGKSLHQKHPGVILFRKATNNAADPELLVLLLVGETPTAGIHPLAFANSVKLIEGYEAGQGEPLRVLSPYFSGSHASLAKALRTAKETTKGRPLRVVSGSANGFDSAHFCKAWGGEPWNSCSPDWFTTTVLPEQLLRRWLFKFLGNPTNPREGAQPDPVVVLFEMDTYFGQNIQGRGKGKQKDHAEESAIPEPRLFNVPFPLHISQLRVTYTKEQLANLQAAGLTQPSRTIPFPQGENERGGAGASVPVQSLAMTTAVNELVLANLLTTVAQKRARHIYLVASDIRDSIFLASRIRDRAPDVQLCTTGNDLLFTHADYNYALEGMVVASSYPSNPTFQGLSSKKSVKSLRILFSNDSSEGCFNAVLVQLQDIRDNCGRSTEGCPVTYMLDYGWRDGPKDDARDTSPGIWLGAVGQNGQMIPVHFISPREIEEDLTNPRESSSRSSDPCEAGLQDHYARYVYKKPAGASPPKAEVGHLWLPNLGMLLFIAISLAAYLFLGKGSAWIANSKWPEVMPERNWLQNRLNSTKQRIDFSIACLACMVLYGWIADVMTLPLQISPGEWQTTTVLWVITVASSLAVIIVLPGKVLSVHWDTTENQKPRPRPWLEPWAERLVHLLEQRRGEYRGMIKLATVLPVADPPTGSSGRRRIFPWAVRCTILAEMIAVGFLVFLAGYQVYQIFCLWLWPDPAPQRMIRFERLIRTANGLSPMLPVFFLCAAFFAWGLLLVKKLFLVSGFSVPCPFPQNCATNESSARNFKDLNSIDRLLRAEIMPPSTWQQHPLVCFVILGVLALVFLKLAHEATAPLDGTWFGHVTLGCFFAGAFLLIFTLAQAYYTWSKLRGLLRFLALQPMGDAFARLPDKVVAVFGHYFSSERPRNSHLQIAIHQFDLFRQTWEKLPNYQKPTTPPVDVTGQPIALPPGVNWNTLAKSLNDEFPSTPDSLRQSFQNVQDAVTEEDFEQDGEILNRNARKCLCVLSHLWPAHSMAEAFGHPPTDGKPTKPGKAFLSLPADNPFREWAIAAEDFVAVEIIRYISQFFVQLRNLLTSLTLGALLLLIAAATYPFRPQYLLVLLLTSLAAAVAVFIVAFLVQVNRDELVSRITRTTPNRFTPDLGFLQATGHYVLPIVGGLLLQFSFFTSGLRAMLTPLFHIIR
jgi:hypothetical protein